MGSLDNHRAVRLRSLLGLTEDFVMELESRYPGTGTSSYSELLKNLPSYEFRSKPNEHIHLAEAFIADIKTAAANLKMNAHGSSLKDDTYPHPVPDLRIVPRV